MATLLQKWRTNNFTKSGSLDLREVKSVREQSRPLSRSFLLNPKTFSRKGAAEEVDDQGVGCGGGGVLTQLEDNLMWFQFKEIGSRELNVELQVDNIESELEGIIEQLDRVFVVSGMNCDLKTGKVEIKLVPGNGFLHVADQEESVRKVHKQEREDGSRKGNRWYTHAERQYLNDMFVRYKGFNETIVKAANTLPNRTVGAIDRQWHEFVNHPHKWAKWIQGGKK